MKNLFIVANWKSNKTASEARNFLEEFGKLYEFKSNVTTIICPPSISVPQVSDYVHTNKLAIQVGVQNVSPFEDGAYTGEISARQAAEFVKYSIVGHSERRKYFGEKNEDVVEKIKQLIKIKITPILCISDMQQLDYSATQEVILNNSSDIIFVYEPPSAISGGGEYRPEDPKIGNENAGEISRKLGKKVNTLYGGSINAQNAASFFSQENIDGGLVGQASLDPIEFSSIIKQC